MAKKKVKDLPLVSELISLMVISCMFVTVYVVVMILMYTDYHEGVCSRHEPASQFLIGDIIILRPCPYSDELLEEALVESYSDVNGPDA